jgi:putrescine transport system ATP-binding protein
MDEGRMVQVDTPARIYEAPNTVYVADFIGDVNIIQGRATQSGDQVQIAWGEGMSDITGTTDKTFDKDEKIHFAIRPEKVTVGVEKPEGTPNAFQGKVLDIAYLGNLSTYHVEMPNGQIIKAQSANTRRLARRAITWDDTVWVSFTPTAGVLLKG